MEDRRGSDHVLTLGHAHDVQGSGPLFRMLSGRIETLLAVRAMMPMRSARRIATRYDKTRESYLGFAALASIELWIAFIHDA